MSTKSCQQEILLSFNSGFLSRICADKSNTDPKGKLMDVEKIEEACWNGLLKEEFPEIFNMAFRAGKCSYGESVTIIPFWR
jgi:hypothetical protein